MSAEEDIRHMTQALRLAEQGVYTTDPNPRVGCVLVQGDHIVGEGWHIKAGEPHAERHALQQAGEQTRGATAYISLEPCSHQGRTPPCSEALVSAGIKRVVVAMEDPNPLVQGQGLAQLRQAGVQVECGLMAATAKALNPGFIKRMATGRPYVRCKMAMSVDGRTAMRSGESRWITGPEARADVHRLRARSSAILTGIGTVLADDPALTVRWEGHEIADMRQPVRVILDPHLSTPLAARMLRLPGRTIVVTSAVDLEACEALAHAGAEIATLPGLEGNLDLAAVMAYLAEQEINEVLTETGATLSGAMLAAGLVDELVLYIAPHLMGSDARGLFHLPALAAMADRISLQIIDIRAVGNDWRLRATVDC